MEKNYLIKIIGVSLLIGILATLVTYFGPRPKREQAHSEPLGEQCYYYLQATTHESFDFAWLRMMVTPEKIIGSYNNYPGEKDSKTGTFEGKLLANNPHEADVLWNTHAEGMTAQEQLKLSFDDTHANAWFGVMKDNPDGHYSYAHPEQLTRGFIMNHVTCSELDTIIADRGPKL